MKTLVDLRSDKGQAYRTNKSLTRPGARGLQIYCCLTRLFESPITAIHLVCSLALGGIFLLSVGWTKPYSIFLPMYACGV